MTLPQVERHRTAMYRTSLSRPIALALADNLLDQSATVFDYGCGRGDDVRHLRSVGFEASGWDPVHSPEAIPSPADVVNLGYVLNVIENPAERNDVLQRAWKLSGHLLIVSARMKWDAKDLVGSPFGDGILTRTRTFQKFYEQSELAEWLEDVTGVRPLAAAPGIFYLFRDPVESQRFLETRVYTYRPRLRIDPHQLYETNRDVLEPVMTFMREHGRPPRPTELRNGALESVSTSIGGLGRAVRLILEVTDDQYWSEVRMRRTEELKVYLALSRFSRRPRASELGTSLGIDLRAFFGSYRDACISADKLLAICREQRLLYLQARSTPIGKQTPSALYVHRDALHELPAVLQVYEGCARVLTGAVPGANVVKLLVGEPQVSFLCYPTFDKVAHPTLHWSLTVNLRTLKTTLRDYRSNDNPPLLHRKEEFIGPTDPRRARFERLTRSEVRAGLYGAPEQIGTLNGWQVALQNAGYEVRGHRLFKRDW